VCTAGGAFFTPSAERERNARRVANIAVFCQAVLFHLRDWRAALAEFVRVLRPGGVAGVIDRDDTLRLMLPTTPLLDRYRAVEERVLAHNGASPNLARHLRRYMHEAGFVRVEQGAHAMAGETLAATSGQAQVLASRFTKEEAPTALAEGWVTESEVEAIAAEIVRWGNRPDALHLLCGFYALGWKDKTA
jgi:SAM-dependent methyltransferase